MHFIAAVCEIIYVKVTQIEGKAQSINIAR